MKTDELLVLGEEHSETPGPGLLLLGSMESLMTDATARGMPNSEWLEVAWAEVGASHRCNQSDGAISIDKFWNNFVGVENAEDLRVSLAHNTAIESRVRGSPDIDRGDERVRVIREFEVTFIMGPLAGITTTNSAVNEGEGDEESGYHDKLHDAQMELLVWIVLVGCESLGLGCVSLKVVR